MDAKSAPPIVPGLLLSVGFGGFVDGIVLHQVLQWHHMLTGMAAHPADTLAGLQTNTLADGPFHAATWLFLLVGTTLMLRAWQQRRLAPSLRNHVGTLLLGWGFFNVVEGIVDHHVLRIHHVRDDLGGPLSWDVGFLIFSIALIWLGVVLRGARRPG